jgi:serine protease Do
MIPVMKIKGVSKVPKFLYLLILLATAMLPPAASAAKDVETIFDDAKNYTAYIDVRIEVPFIEDYKDSFFGAGFVIDRSRRWILTNAHVAGKSPAEIFVTFSDGTRVDATPVYIDSYLDVAILNYDNPEGLDLDEAELECETTPGTGHPVGTFGHPEGLQFTGTRGIISGRTSQFGSEWLQTDAPISGGNSGGPLISLETGRVVGINSASIEGDDAQNTNLAVPSTQACRIVELMLNDLDPRPADLGVAFFNDGEEPTTVVGQVFARGQSIGLQRGDEILSVDGVQLERTTEGELLHHLRGQLDQAELRLMRAGEKITISTSLTPRPNIMDRTGIYVAGALFSVTNHLDITSLTLKPVIMVHSVESGSAAESAGIEEFDLLLGIDGRRISSLGEVIEAIEANESGEIAKLDLVRFIYEDNRFLGDVIAEIPLDDAEMISFSRE